MNNLISVIIPCHNGVNYLAEAIAGIKKQNIETEIIVADDGSTDNTARLAGTHGCTVISIPHSGVSAARNAGLRKAGGGYVLFCDHDDILCEGALYRFLTELQLDSSLQIVMAKARDFISPELSDADKKILSPRSNPYYGQLSGAAFIAKDVFAITGGFNESLATGETVDFILRAESLGVKIKKIDFVAAGRRLHNTNRGRMAPKQEQKDYSRILRAKLRRGG
ncbi:glycosyl transferase family A [Spirochaetia bacterium]|nr:glycosyl transferase family A [Spirochaetia bacterium]